jgi:putative membrane protein
MIRFIGKLFIHAIAVMLTAWLLPGVHVDDFLSAIAVAIVLSLLNTFVKPVLILLTIPITLVTFGLFLIVVNAIIIWFADGLIDNFRVDGFWWAVFFSFVVSLIKSLLSGENNNNTSNRKKHAQ